MPLRVLVRAGAELGQLGRTRVVWLFLLPLSSTAASRLPRQPVFGSNVGSRVRGCEHAALRELVLGFALLCAGSQGEPGSWEEGSSTTGSRHRLLCCPLSHSPGVKSLRASFVVAVVANKSPLSCSRLLRLCEIT